MWIALLISSEALICFVLFAMFLLALWNTDNAMINDGKISCCRSRTFVTGVALCCSVLLVSSQNKTGRAPPPTTLMIIFSLSDSSCKIYFECCFLRQLIGRSYSQVLSYINPNSVHCYILELLSPLKRCYLCSYTFSRDTTMIFTILLFSGNILFTYRPIQLISIHYLIIQLIHHIL